jgi:hypothetical protein
VAPTSRGGAFNQNKRQAAAVTGERPQHGQPGHAGAAGDGEQERGRRGAGDEQQDHHLVRALQHPPGHRPPPAAVVERADPEQSAEGGGVDRRGEGFRRTMRGRDQHGADHE